MHVLLTGLSSFVGGNLARHFLQAGHEVTATYRTQNAATEKLGADLSLLKLRLVPLDLANRAAYATNVIVHAAGVSAGVAVSVGEMLACNVEGTDNLIRYGLSARSQIYLHVDAVGSRQDCRPHR
jgi:nucleoside-diphosphate-sugar epimerase